jgi:A/G-specific adenine glycosylase
MSAQQIRAIRDIRGLNLLRFTFMSAKSQGRDSFSSRLVRWFARAARDLPWRRTRDLYAIWISEVMLQQTQVATVIPYYERFLSRFPNVASLAAADEHEVLRLWEGLGYYRRARQLHAAARQISADHGGEFPTSFDGVRALPGIGRYTAGAILSIGLDQRLPILEANTVRVFSRLTAFAGDTTSTDGQKHLWSVAESLLPRRRAGSFNQALMELGSEICTPRAPKCDRCPVAIHCEARCLNRVHEIPRPPRVTNYEDIVELAIIVRHRRRVLLRKCQPGERWAGLWDFPRFAAADPASPSREDHIAAQTKHLTGVAITSGPRIATLKHGVTRFRITLHCYEAKLAGRNGSKSRLNPAASRWVTINDLDQYPLSVTGRKISRLLTS